MIRIGLLGVGHLGKIHLKLLKELKEFEVAGIYDVDKVSAAPIANEFGVKIHDSAEDLFKVCEAVDIVTPTLFHFDYAVAAIRSGKHIFVEKPVTQNAAEAKKLVQLVNEAKVVAHAGHVERFNPAFTAIRSEIQRPVFIDCQRIAQYNPRGTDVSVVLDLMVHDIDLVLSLVRSNVKKISATGSSVLCPTEDIAEARLEFDNGCVATLSASRVATHNLRKMTVFEKDCYYSLDLMEKTAVRSFVNDKKGAKEISHEPMPVTPHNAIQHELRLFAGAIRREANEAVTLEEAYNTMKVADDILAAIHRNVI